RAVVAAMDDKASGLDRVKSGKACCGPIARPNGRKSERTRGAFATGPGNGVAHGRLVWRPREMDFDRPGPVRFFESRNGGFAETLGERVGDRSRRICRCREPRENGRGLRRLFSLHRRSTAGAAIAFIPDPDYR